MLLSELGNAGLQSGEPAITYNDEAAGSSPATPTLQLTSACIESVGPRLQHVAWMGLEDVARRRESASLSSDDFGSSVERAATLHSLWEVEWTVGDAVRNRWSIS